MNPFGCEGHRALFTRSADDKADVKDASAMLDSNMYMNGTTVRVPHIKNLPEPSSTWSQQYVPRHHFICLYSGCSELVHWVVALSVGVEQGLRAL